MCHVHLTCAIKGNNFNVCLSNYCCNGQQTINHRCLPVDTENAINFPKTKRINLINSIRPNDVMMLFRPEIVTTHHIHIPINIYIWFFFLHVKMRCAVALHWLNVIWFDLELYVNFYELFRLENLQRIQWICYISLSFLISFRLNHWKFAVNPLNWHSQMLYIVR